MDVADNNGLRTTGDSSEVGISGSDRKMDEPPDDREVAQRGPPKKRSVTSRTTATTMSADIRPEAVQTVIEDTYDGRGEKRKYVYKTRTRTRDSGSSEKRQRFLSHASTTEDFFRQLTCCKRKRCFSHVNLSHVVKTASQIMTMNNVDRKSTLEGLLSDSGVFMFDGRPVCAEFLVLAFRFSRDLQSTVKTTDSSRLQRREVLIYTGQSKAQSRDSIVVFLRRIAEQTGNSMPDTPEVHLPFYDKKEVYKLFCDQFKVLEQTPPPTMAYFYATWKDSVSHIKVRTVTRFAKCGICEAFKDEMKRAARSTTSMTQLQRDRKAHYDFIATERQAYKMNQDNAALNASQYMSIAIDGADQSAFGLPHFVTVTKDTRGHSIKVKLVGIVQHGRQKHISLYTMSENHETGANHVIECLHRFLNNRNDQFGLSKNLYIQMDNCSRENKNRYTLGYLESLVAWGVFDEICASFLPVGHTHIDIDQVFSRTATRLHANDAVTLSELHSELSQSYTPTPIVNHVAKVANFSGLLEKTKTVWNGRDARIGDLHYFRFRKYTAEKGGVMTTSTTCEVKRKSMDSWESLHNQTNTDKCTGFLTAIPDLTQTPPTNLKCPPNRSEIQKRLHSEETRIANADKMLELQTLVDDVYADRSEPFHWDLTTTVECKHNRTEDICRMHEDQEEGHTSAAGQMKYDLNSFVIVRHGENSTRVPFWVGKISKIIKSPSGHVKDLEMQWFETGIGKDPYKGTYKPTDKFPHRKGFTPWKSQVAISSVMVTFGGLTKKRQLSAEVCKQIQASLHSHGQST